MSGAEAGWRDLNVDSAQNTATCRFLVFTRLSVHPPVFGWAADTLPSLQPVTFWSSQLLNLIGR